MTVVSGHIPVGEVSAEETVDYRRWAVIDVETATASRDSACALGLVLVDGGRSSARHRWHIQPPDNEYDAMNSWVHGITARDTAHAPGFAEVWNEVSRLVEGRVLLAHNAGFDLSVVYHSLNSFQDRAANSAVEYPFACTLVLARVAWPGRYSYSLPILAENLGFSFDHHDPLEDAAAAAAIASALTETHGYDLAATCAAHHLRMGHFSTDAYLGCWARSTKTRLSSLEATIDHVNEGSPLLGKTIVFTGTLSVPRLDAAQSVVNAGGQCQNNISKKVNYLVVGVQDASKFAPGQSASSKMRRFEALVRDGHSIELITEHDLLQLLAMS